jgi:hypothetical protein
LHCDQLCRFEEFLIKEIDFYKSQYKKYTTAPEHKFLCALQ